MIGRLLTERIRERFKWGTTRSVRMPRAFAEAYPDAAWSVVHPENFGEFSSATNQHKHF